MAVIYDAVVLHLLRGFKEWEEEHLVDSRKRSCHVRAIAFKGHDYDKANALRCLAPAC